MNLWGSQYASGIKELLKGLDDANLKDLAKTACSNHFTGASSKDDVEIILRCTDSVGKLFSYQRVTSQLLRDYLYKKKQPIVAVESRTQMVERVKLVWQISGRGAGAGPAGSGVSLWESPEASKVKELLKGLDDTNLKALANTASNNRITARTPNDNVEIILRWTESVDKLLSYQRITIKVLRDYLYKKKLPISATENKQLLVARVKQLWFGPSGANPFF